MVSPRPIWPEASLNLSAPTASICLAPCLACCVVDSAAILRWLSVPFRRSTTWLSVVYRTAVTVEVAFLDCRIVEVWLVLVRWVSAYAHNRTTSGARK